MSEIVDMDELKVANYSVLCIRSTLAVLQLLKC